MRELKCGIYRHYKGRLYLVLGLAHDANAGDLASARHTPMPTVTLGERTVVVYVGLELDDAHDGPRLAVRTYDDFVAWLHPDDWSVCPSPIPYAVNGIECDCSHYKQFTSLTQRFAYVGPTWEPRADD